MLLLCVVYLILRGAIAALDITFPIDEITIPQGNITGEISFYGNYRKFIGIPYATVKERFQAPSDPPTWTDTLYATNDISACPQYIELLPSPFIGTEECLGLNIYTPIVTQSRPLPVIVFIHGGRWSWGSNSQYIYDPRYLVQKKVIVVTINYRLGLLGFLCLGNKGAPGNAGLKDQVAALKWVKNNIEYFGGDPNLVTLFGEGTGAASVAYLMTSPLVNDLFQRIILQSGSSLDPTALDRDPIKTASSVAAKLGFNSTDPDELLEFFKKVSVQDLVTASYKGEKNYALDSYLFKPCVEAATEGAIITTAPIDQLKSTTFNSDVQVIIGYNNKEGISLTSKYDNFDYRHLLEDFSMVLPDNIELSNENDRNDFIKEVKKMYFESEQGTAIVHEDLLNYFSDAFVIYPLIATTESLMNNSNASVYNYFFTYDSTRNLAKLADNMRGESGADHGDEMFYLFEPGPLQLLPVTTADAKTIYKITTMWAYFALKGDPSIPKELPWTTKWSESTTNKLEFMQIDEDLKMISLPNKDRIDFWRNAYLKYGWKK